ncbi:hypothetical protein [Dyella sp. ASV21]|uniref:ECs_2282 family putative zinc-binding protein n=1 Tax=Dyella sp. ASV21 TaxID=2795114 RepID=UPI0018ED4557|nr:hypothetical protein [Dyella sp. ASV21]
MAALRCASLMEAMATTFSVGITCSCGSTKFDRPENPRPSDVITCQRCGKKTRWDQLVKKAGEQAVKQVKDAMKDVFRRAGFQ